MSFSDPQTVTPPTLGAQSCNKVNTGPYSATYQVADRTFALEIRHQYAGKRKDRIRSNVKVTQKKIAADPLITDTNNEYSQSVSMTIDRPVAGFSNAEAIDLASGLIVWLNASSYANLSDVVEMQS
jgi:hypothetical protein